MSRQPVFARLERHDVSDGNPICSAGAHVGTVRPMYWPLRTRSVRASGNCTAWPKYSESRMSGDFATTTRSSFLRASSTTTAACAAPP